MNQKKKNSFYFFNVVCNITTAPPRLVTTAQKSTSLIRIKTSNFLLPPKHYNT